MKLLLARIQLVALFLVASFLLFIGAAGQDSIVLRRRLMESNNSAIANSLNKAIKEKNFTEVEGNCNVILENMERVLDFFPAGSLSENSRAKPEIWVKWGEFSKHPANVKKAAQELAAAAKDKDEEAVKLKFKALGVACKSCHDTFRLPKPKTGEDFH